MLNFGHLRQTSPPESCRAQTSHPPCFIRAGKAFGPPLRAAKRFAAVNARTFFFVSRDIPRLFSASVRSPLSPAIRRALRPGVLP